MRVASDCERILEQKRLCRSSTDHRSLSSKHILNAQVSIRAPCCKAWYDCAECHAEAQDHKLRKTVEMIFMCKKCKKAFRKDMSEYDESDEYCPHCDNHYVSAFPDCLASCAFASCKRTRRTRTRTLNHHSALESDMLWAAVLGGF